MGIPQESFAVHRDDEFVGDRSVAIDDDDDGDNSIAVHDDDAGEDSEDQTQNEERKVDVQFVVMFVANGQQYTQLDESFIF